MPIYEYICQDCGKKFEALRSINNADTQINCENCSSPKTHRVASACFSKHEGGSTPSSSCSSCAGGSCSSCHH